VTWRDRGSASVWVLAMGAVVVAVGLAAALAAAAATARHRAQAAADLGALAGARYAADGEELACTRAAAIVAANGARLAGCRLDGLDVVVTAEVAVSGAPAGPEVADAEVRAGSNRPHAHRHAMVRCPGGDDAEPAVETRHDLGFGGPAW
jgi:secretion/DNA translocation related TadE-like protein